MALLGSTGRTARLGAWALLAWGALFLPAACSDEGGTSTTGATPVCAGVVDDQGNCVAECDPSKCLEQNVCVDNACRLLCDSQDDCVPGTQECVPAVTDATDDGGGDAVKVCRSNGNQPVTDGNGFPAGWYGTACPFGQDQCAVQTACPNGLSCDLEACSDCELDEEACDGIEPCSIGRCAQSGERCTFNTCPDAECTPFRCVDFSAEGDTTAYCTHDHCADDSECPSNFYCGVTRDPRGVCGKQPPAVNVCGSTEEPCVDPADFNANGQQLFEGSQCLLRRTCLLRDECAPCQNNAQCDGTSDVCALRVNEAVCLRFCNMESDCLGDEVCVPYNPTSGIGTGGTCAGAPNVDCATGADCPNPEDECVIRNVCAPVTGACNGGNIEGEKFCVHCRNDTDCGGNYSCLTINPDETACIDLTVTCSSSADCPDSPVTGASGRCIDEPQSVLDGRCWWPANSEGLTCK